MLTENYNIVSVMSGTSLDGIDVLYANFSYNGDWKFEILKAETIDYSEKWKQILSALTKNSFEELKEIDISYSEYLAQNISSFITTNKIEEIDFIASHGHTALHNPKEGYTYQIGNLQILANILGYKTICDFRSQDVQLGGQGAPLVPIGDRLLFSNYQYCINLGGFANISFEENNSRIAFDICPVNIVLNHYVKQLGFQYDDKGKIAQNGIINHDLLNELNLLEYYNQKPPKSLGLEWVEEKIFPVIENYNLEVKTILRTFVEHIAFQISKTLSIDDASVLVTGGGAYNTFLIERINHYLTKESIIPSKQIIEFKEALIFGLLGVLKDRNEVNCLSSVTGAKNNHSSGKILIPKINT